MGWGGVGIGRKEKEAGRGDGEVRRKEEGEGREEDVVLQPSILYSNLTGSIPLLAVAT